MIEQCLCLLTTIPRYTVFSSVYYCVSLFGIRFASRVHQQLPCVQVTRCHLQLEKQKQVETDSLPFEFSAWKRFGCEQLEADWGHLQHNLMLLSLVGPPCERYYGSPTLMLRGCKMLQRRQWNHVWTWTWHAVESNHWKHISYLLTCSLWPFLRTCTFFNPFVRKVLVCCSLAVAASHWLLGPPNAQILGLSGVVFALIMLNGGFGCKAQG